VFYQAGNSVQEAQACGMGGRIMPGASREEKDTMIRFLTAVVVAAAAWVAAAADNGPSRVLFCIADDASLHFGAYGCTWVKTPTIDRLARQGTTFERAYTPTAKCSPARAAILTGRYPWQLGAAANHNPFFPAEYKSFTESLADAGVVVGAAGKFWSPGVAKTAAGADRTWGIAPPGLARPSQAAARYRDFLAGLPAGKPAFFWFGSTNPHRPYARDAGLAAGKTPAEIDRVPGYWPDDEIVRRDMLDYATRVEAFDAEVGALLDVLEASGQADETVVIVTSDHGMPFPRVKGHCFEAAHHVPLIVRIPDGPNGRRVSEFVNFVDLAPTMLDLFGIAAAASGMQPISGQSFLDLASGRPAATGRPRNATFIGRERNDVNGREGTPSGLGYPARGIREGDYLYVKNFAPDRWPCCDPDLGLTDTDPGPTKAFIASAGQLDRYWKLCFGLRPAEELYDVGQDPDCLRNLAGDPAHASLRKRLAAGLLAALEDQQDPRVIGKGGMFDDFLAPPYGRKPWAKPSDALRERDVVVYGGTSAAVIAAIRATMLGADVVIVSPDRHLGGLTSGGLGYTDSGNTAAIGGLARDFYRRVWSHYQQPEAWRWQPRDTFRALGQGVKRADVADGSMWLFEPHVAERIFDDWLAEHAIEVVRGARLDREQGVELSAAEDGATGAGAPRIKAITTLPDGDQPSRRFAAKVFIDATYEGDLMAAAGVGYHVGREANSVYGEEWNGNQVGILHHSHFFAVPIDPFRTPGDPASGLLPLVSADPPGTRGEGDARVQAYCFRMCLTDHPDNRVPFAKPAGYDPARYELLARLFAAGWRDVFGKFDAIPNRKTDTNNHGPFSFDHIGGSVDYPEASYERRREIVADHARYQQGLLWFLTHDERVPAEIRTVMRQWGLPKDEYTDNGHWSPQLYIRESRRMLGADVLTEHECLGRRQVRQPIGMGSYALDSHNVRRYVTPEGTVQNEGDIGVKPPGPYQIGYGSLVPKRGTCDNLLVPVCLSASHIAYGSARMEPVFMLLGDAAASAAVLAIRGSAAVGDVDYPSLRSLLQAQGQILE
jgi:arylsulfatase A-like enzyme